MLTNLRHRLMRAAARAVQTKRFIMRNTAPLVSFTFDDVPDSAYLNGASILEEYGVRGTFYIAAGICGTKDKHWRVISPEQVAALHTRGHEIGAHTFSHVNVQTLSAANMADETRANEARLREICGDVAIRNFAYPFGDVSLPRKLELQRHFASCRGIYEGVNAGSVDLGLLKATPLYGELANAGALGERIDHLIRQNGWLIFYTHDVADPPSWIGCSPALLDAALRLVRAHGIECVTVREGLRRIGLSEPQTLPSEAMGPTARIMA